MSKHKSEDYKITAVKYYLENDTNYTKTCKKCSGIWSRDVNSATNIYRLAKNTINGLEQPKYLCREKKDENIKVEKPIKDKIKKVVQKKAKKSVEVVDLTNS